MWYYPTDVKANYLFAGMQESRPAKDGFSLSGNKKTSVGRESRVPGTIIGNQVKGN
ncbi:unnamed protein product, partial [marine sediment metagenome]